MSAESSRNEPMKRRAFVLVLMALLAVLVPTVSVPNAAARSQVTITLVTHDAFGVSKSVLHGFTRETGINVRVLRAGDAGATLSQVILTKDHPLGDVFYGVDNTFLTRAFDAGIFDAYRSPALTHVPATYVLDARHRVTPVDRADVCINTDKTWFASHHVTVPKTLDDLTKPAYRSLLVAENPATSSTGLAFLAATVAHFGEKVWRSYWAKLRANDLQVVAGWEQAYDGAFTAGAGHGDRPLVVSYASSPPAAVYYAKPRPARSPVGTMLATCFRQIEFVGVLHGTSHPRAARAFVDFMLSRRFQEDMPLGGQMFVFPVREDATPPKLFTKFADVPPHPLSLSAAAIGRNRDRWIQQWTDTVLR